MNQYRVYFHCNGIDEAHTVEAASVEEAQAQVEETFPKSAGWYVFKVETLNAFGEVVHTTTVQEHSHTKRSKAVYV